jgi:rsbT co-antagonist protein RsbR
MGTSQSTAIINYEERYKSLVDQSVDLAIYFLSSTGIIESWNKGAEHFKQYKAEEVIGKHLSMFSTEEDKKKHVVEQELDEATQHGRFEGGGWRVRKDGTKFWEDEIISALRDTNNKVIGFVKVSHDATDKRKQQDTIAQQRLDLIELSTPVMQLWEGVLALPIIGTLDSDRSNVVMDNLLSAITKTGASVAILDISGVPTVDTTVAQHLMKTMQAAKLMGADCIISGIRPEIAQTMVHLGIDLTEVKTRSSMARALAEALDSMQLTVVSTTNGNGKHNGNGNGKKED